MFRLVKKQPKPLTFADVPPKVGFVAYGRKHLRLAKQVGVGGCISNAFDTEVVDFCYFFADAPIDSLLSPPPEAKKLTFGDIPEGSLFVSWGIGYSKLHGKIIAGGVVANVFCLAERPCGDSFGCFNITEPVEPASDYEWLAVD